MARQVGQHRDAQAEEALPFLFLRRTRFLDLLEDVLQLVAQEDRDDRGRGFVGAQAVVVPRAGNACQQQILVLLHRAHDRGAEEEEHQVVVGSVPRVHQVSVRGPEGPVEVLSAPVDPLEGLLVQQAHQAIVARIPLQDPHHHLLMVGGHVGVFVNRRHLVLPRGHLVVTRLHRDTQPVEVHLHGLDIGHHPIVD